MIPVVLIVIALTITPVFSSCTDTLTDHELTLGTYPIVPVANQIRPSKFGGSFNQPNVPTINVVVDMVAPSAGLPI